MVRRVEWDVDDGKSASNQKNACLMFFSRSDSCFRSQLSKPKFFNRDRPSVAKNFVMYGLDGKPSVNCPGGKWH